MKTLELGNTGEEVSALCLGTMYFGSRIDEETSRKLLDMYYEAGGRFLDTANDYATWLDDFEEPKSEPLLGRWIEERGHRDDLFIATKVGFNNPGTPQSLNPEIIKQEVEKSLKRMKIDTIDLLYAHTDDLSTPQKDTMRTFNQLIDEEKVRYIGASNFLTWRLLKANMIAEENNWSPYQCIQTKFSYLTPNRGSDPDGNHPPANEELIDYCAKNNITILAYSPLLQGCYGREDRTMPEQFINTYNRVKMGVVQDIADEKGVNGNTIVLAWMLQGDPPVIPVFSGSSEKQIKQDLESLEINLTQEEMKRLNSVGDNLRANNQP